MTQPYTDSQLRSFLDGTIDEQLAAEIEVAVNADPALADRVEALMQDDQLADAVRTAFAPVLEAPVPLSLERVVMPAAAATVVDLAAVRGQGGGPRAANDDQRIFGKSAWRWPQLTAMAASLAIGLFVGGPLLQGGSSGDGAMVIAGSEGPAAPAAIAAMLDEAPSGRAVDLASLGTGEVVLSFRNAEGQLCRQFSVSGASGTSDALACSGAGGWQMEALGRRAGPAGDMRLAGGDAAVSVVTAVDAMIDSEPLVGAEEQAELEAR